LDREKVPELLTFLHHVDINQNIENRSGINKIITAKDLLTVVYCWHLIVIVLRAKLLALFDNKNIYFVNSLNISGRHLLV
jgi:hypothetical protein